MSAAKVTIDQRGTEWIARLSVPGRPEVSRSFASKLAAEEWVTNEAEKAGAPWIPIY